MSDIQASLAAGVSPPVELTGTAYTLSREQMGKTIIPTSASATTITVPADDTVHLPIGYTTTVFAKGAGAVTIAAATGVTIRTPETLVLAKQYATAALEKIAANEWLIAGNLVAA